MTLQVTQRGWLRQLINAITEGCPVIIENLGEDIDAVLDPVLSRAVYRKGRQLFLNLVFVETAPLRGKTLELFDLRHHVIGVEHRLDVHVLGSGSGSG